MSTAFTTGCYTTRGTLGLAPPGELLPKAKEAARRAIALDDEVRDAHFVLAQAHQSFDWDWLGAEHEFRGLSGFPNAETLNLTMSYVDVGLIGHRVQTRKGPV